VSGDVEWSKLNLGKTQFHEANSVLFILALHSFAATRGMHSSPVHPTSKSKTPVTCAGKPLDKRGQQFGSFKFEVTGKVQGVFFRKYTQVNGYETISSGRELIFDNRKPRRNWD
jgi:hypothetical protein